MTEVAMATLLIGIVLIVAFYGDGVTPGLNDVVEKRYNCSRDQFGRFHTADPQSVPVECIDAP